MRFNNSLILVTGGYGFIGSNFIRYLFEKTDFKGKILNVDKLNYASNLMNLNDIEKKYKNRYFFEKIDISVKEQVESILEKYKPELIINFAAETHVDRAIHFPEDFIKSNILGTFTLLESSRKILLKNKNFRFHHISTDEVFGSLRNDEFATEEYPYKPSNPYSASKASSNNIAYSYFKTFSMDITISNSSNNFGPYQFPEKFIPVVIINLINNTKIPIYGKGLNQRTWIYVQDNCDAIWKIANFSKKGETYNIGSKKLLTNIELVKTICNIWDKEFGGKNSFDLIEFVKDRPGHDLRYALSTKKIERDLNWNEKSAFENALKDTIKWYINNKEWVKSISSKDYKDWIKRNYTNR